MDTQDLVVKITVMGDCGIVHPTFEDWQQCQVCERFLQQALQDGRAYQRYWNK